MKKKILAILMASCMVFAIGCGKDTTTKNNNDNEIEMSESDSDVDHDADRNEGSDSSLEAVGDADDVEQTADSTTEAPAISLSEEMAEIESKSLAYENADWDIPQQEMNAKGYEWFALWDDELNSLWGRLTKTLSDADKEALIAEQNAWIKRKEQQMIAAGFEAYGGTLRPLLESDVAKDMTRERTYYLAEYLAKQTGDNYVIPNEIKESFQGIDCSLDDVFQSFSGNYTLSDTMYVNVNTIEASPFSNDFPEGTKWLFWYANSDVLTNQNVYAYNKDRIIFEKEGVYYVLEKGVDGQGVYVSTGTDLAFMEPIME
ncbi:MAG: lysozyme inhibitor LprI family protein [Lachnospiraceae bacterium]